MADGARWIWERVDFHFAFAQGTLDIYHALEHVGDAAQALFGEGTTQAARWHERAREALLAEGYPGIERVIDQVRSIAVRRRSAPRWGTWPLTCVRISNIWTIQSDWPPAGPSAVVALKAPAKTI